MGCRGWHPSWLNARQVLYYGSYHSGLFLNHDAWAGGEYEGSVWLGSPQQLLAGALVPVLFLARHFPL